MTYTSGMAAWPLRQAACHKWLLPLPAFAFLYFSLYFNSTLIGCLYKMICILSFAAPFWDFVQLKRRAFNSSIIHHVLQSIALVLLPYSLTAAAEVKCGALLRGSPASSCWRLWRILLQMRPLYVALSALLPAVWPRCRKWSRWQIYYNFCWSNDNQMNWISLTSVEWCEESATN